MVGAVSTLERSRKMLLPVVMSTASGTALLILGESVVVTTDLTHGGINARVTGILPHLRFS